MIPGEDEFYECPICGNILSRGSLMSGNTFGAKLYSDGKQIARMLPEFPSITKCPKCTSIFWLKDEIKSRKTGDADRASFLTIPEYLSVLEHKNYDSSAEENFIRTRIWWLFNDRVRSGRNLFISEAEKTIWKDNIDCLISMQDYEDINKRIMLAELNRNLGNFQECKDILTSISDPNMDWLIEAFENELTKENTKVFQLR